MGILSIVGIVLSLVVIVVGILLSGGNLMDFVDPISILVTIVPTILVLVAINPIELLAAIPSHFKVLIGKGYELDKYIAQITELSKKAYTEGLLSLQDATTDEPYFDYALRMLVDGLDEESIQNHLEENLESLEARHKEAIGVYEKGAAYAPAFGMVGTVLGLIIMLKSLDFNDPAAVSNLGTSMAVALITTFYGAILANVVFLPIVGRLKLLHSREVHCKTIIGNSILAILRRDNPRVIEDGLLELLSTKGKKKLIAAGGTAASGRSGGAEH